MRKKREKKSATAALEVIEITIDPNWEVSLKLSAYLLMARDLDALDYLCAALISENQLLDGMSLGLQSLV